MALPCSWGGSCAPATAKTGGEMQPQERSSNQAWVGWDTEAKVKRMRVYLPLQEMETLNSWDTPNYKLKVISEPYLKAGGTYIALDAFVLKNQHKRRQT